MKKKICFMLLFMLFLYGGKVRAAESACSYSEQAQLNSDFANVKVAYEEVVTMYDTATNEPVAEKDIDPKKKDIVSETEGYYEGYSFKISILNMTKNMYVEVTNDNTDETRLFTYEDAKDGTIEFNHGSDMIVKVTTYTFKFYSSDETGCPDEDLGKKTLVTPRYNDLSYTQVCEENPKIDACQKYVTFPDEGQDAFFALVDSQLSDEEQTKEDGNDTSKTGIMEFITKNKEVILISVGALVVIIGAAVIITKRNNKKRSAL